MNKELKQFLAKYLDIDIRFVEDYQSQYALIKAYDKHLSTLPDSGVSEDDIHNEAQNYNASNHGGGQSFQDGAKWLQSRLSQPDIREILIKFLDWIHEVEGLDENKKRQVDQFLSALPDSEEKGLDISYEKIHQELYNKLYTLASPEPPELYKWILKRFKPIK